VVDIKSVLKNDRYVRDSLLEDARRIIKDKLIQINELLKNGKK